MVAASSLVHESVRERRLLFVELFQFGFVGFGKVGAGVDKLLIVVLDQAQRFGIEMERGALVCKPLDTRANSLGFR